MAHPAGGKHGFLQAGSGLLCFIALRQVVSVHVSYPHSCLHAFHVVEFSGGSDPERSGVSMEPLMCSQTGVVLTRYLCLSLLSFMKRISSGFEDFSWC